MSAEASIKPPYFRDDLCDLDEFKSLVSQSLDKIEAAYAHDIVKNVPIYRVDLLKDVLTDPARRRVLMAEWTQILRNRSGALVLKNAAPNKAAIDDATDAYSKIIAAEKLASGGGADHFATAGNNDRIWNSLQKLCEHSPELFARYFASPAIDAVCEAWLGPNYQMTSQINLVRPGGAAQQAHRDYHLGFQTANVAASYPAHIHDLSPLLTLQGAIAHCDMPLESGPTKLLPFSQAYRPGYVAWRREDFRAHFEKNYIQLPLSKGDALFFSPAIFHAAGANTSADIQRMGNLLQVSTAFGRAMETVDRAKMCKLLYPALRQLGESGKATPDAISAVIACSAEGYSFPTNLDLDPPSNGLAPETQNALLHRALDESWSDTKFFTEIDALMSRKHA